MISPAVERGTSKGVIIGFVTAILAVAVATAAFAPKFGNASSHREAPLVAADPQVDSTDLYAFVSPDDPSTVTLISNWIPFEEPAGGPNFYSFAPGVRYDINISNDGDASPEIIYRWKFANHYRNPNTFLYNTGPVSTLNDADLNFYQTYDLQRVTVGGNTQTVVNDAVVAPNDVGAASMPNYEALSNSAITSLSGGGKTFTGPINDPFFLDLRVFDLLYGADFGEA